jgi:hypothetical protein
LVAGDSSSAIVIHLLLGAPEDAETPVAAMASGRCHAAGKFHFIVASALRFPTMEWGISISLKTVGLSVATLKPRYRRKDHRIA